MISLFDISLQLNGFPIKKAKADLDAITQLTDEEFMLFLQKQKDEIVDFHLKNNLFYNELVGDKIAPKWENLPILNKQNLQKPLEERLSKGYSKKTSTSTKHPDLAELRLFLQKINILMP